MVSLSIYGFLFNVVDLTGRVDSPADFSYPFHLLDPLGVMPILTMCKLAGIS